MCALIRGTVSVPTPKRALLSGGKQIHALVYGERAFQVCGQFSARTCDGPVFDFRRMLFEVRTLGRIIPRPTAKRCRQHSPAARSAPCRRAQARLKTMQAITARASFVAEPQLPPSTMLNPLDHLRTTSARLAKNAQLPNLA
jgi:hypothetical protein